MTEPSLACEYESDWNFSFSYTFQCLFVIGVLRFRNTPKGSFVRMKWALASGSSQKHCRVRRLNSGKFEINSNCLMNDPEDVNFQDWRGA